MVSLRPIKKPSWIFWQLTAPQQRMQPIKLNGKLASQQPLCCLNRESESSLNSIVTGASEKGTWVRLLNIPVEGKLISGFGGVDVGDRIRVTLIAVDVEKGFIDFNKSAR